RAIAAINGRCRALGRSQDERVIAIVADERIVAAVARDRVAVGISGQAVGLRAAGQVLDIGEAGTKAGADPGQQGDRYAGRVERIIEGIDTRAAVDGPGHTRTGTELEDVGAAAAYQVLDI